MTLRNTVQRFSRWWSEEATTLVWVLAVIAALFGLPGIALGLVFCDLVDMSVSKRRP